MPFALFLQLWIQMLNCHRIYFEFIAFSVVAASHTHGRNALLLGPYFHPEDSNITLRRQAEQCPNKKKPIPLTCPSSDRRMLSIDSRCWHDRWKPQTGVVVRWMVTGAIGVWAFCYHCAPSHHWSTRLRLTQNIRKKVAYAGKTSPEKGSTAGYPMPTMEQLLDLNLARPSRYTCESKRTIGRTLFLKMWLFLWIQTVTTVTSNF